MSVQNLVYRDMLTACQSALLKGTLSALAPEPKCQYILQVGDTVYGCAVGCALNGEAKVKILLHDVDALNEKPIDYLLEEGIVTTDDDVRVRILQRKHDNWATAGNRLVVAIKAGERFDYEAQQVQNERASFIGHVDAEIARLDNEAAQDAVIERARYFLDQGDEDDADVNAYEAFPD